LPVAVAVNSKCSLTKYIAPHFLPIPTSPHFLPSVLLLTFQDQLEFKRNIIVKAFERYFGTQSPLIPSIDPTHGSPLQYSYRTKITPHFEIPRSRKETIEQSPKEIGFVEKGRRRILDIEGTQSLPCLFLVVALELEFIVCYWDRDDFRMFDCDGTFE
jgi:hypothetical protein